MARAKRPSLALVPDAPLPVVADALREKLDALALDLADDLKDHEHPLSERLAGIKVLTEYWKSDKRNSGEKATKPISAFDGYQRMIAGEE